MLLEGIRQPGLPWSGQGGALWHQGDEGPGLAAENFLCSAQQLLSTSSTCDLRKVTFLTWLLLSPVLK